MPGLPADYRDDWHGHRRGAEMLGLARRFDEANWFETDDGVIPMMMRNENETRMGVTESRDDGVVFDRHMIVGDDAQGEPRTPGYLEHGRYGYPFLIVAGGTTLVIYSTGTEDINVARFELPPRRAPRAS